MDLVRNIQDPQHASRALVDHALARFSTDNLSCMVVRFDNKKLLSAVESSDKIGVEGDPPSQGGGVSEAQAIVIESKRVLDEGGEPLVRPATGEMMDDVERNQETGPELNPEALEKARKDSRPKEDTGRPHSPNTPSYEGAAPNMNQNTTQDGSGSGH